MPAIRSLLQTFQADHNRPKTRDEVESVRVSGACIMLKQSDAQRLERSRGYADLQPPLAREQWQLVRRTSVDD